MPQFHLFIVCLLCLGSVDPVSAQSQERESYQFAAALFDRGLYARSIPAWRTFLREFPQVQKASQARFHLAESLFQTNDQEGALQQFSQFLRSNPKKFKREAGLRTGEIQASLGHLPQAIEAFEIARKKPGDSIWLAATHGSAEAHLKLKQPQKARALFLAILRTKDNDLYRANAALALGFLAFESGEFEEARKNFAAVPGKECEPSMAVESLLMLGESEFKLKKYGAAVDAFRQVIQARIPEFSADAWIGLAKVAIRRDQPEAAKTSIEKAMGLGNGTKIAQTVIREAALLHEGGKTQFGLEILKTIPATTAGIGKDLSYWRGVLASESGDSASGLKALEASVAQGSTPTRTYRLADALMRAGRFEDAVRRFAELESESVDARMRYEARFSRGFCLSQLGRHEEAARVFRLLDREGVALELRLDAAMARGESLFEEEEYRTALGVYASVQERCQEDELRKQAIYKQGWCYFKLKQFENALGQFQTIMNNPADPAMAAEASHLSARCLKELGRNKEALELHKKVATHLGSQGGVGIWSIMILADNALQRERPEEALRYYVKANEGKLDEQTGAAVLFGIAASLSACGRDEEAEEAYSRFITVYPENERINEARLGLSWALFRQGAMARARQSCKKKLKDLVFDGERIFIAGLIERGANNHQVAADLFQQVVDLDPPHSRKNEAMFLGGLSSAKYGANAQALRLLQGFLDGDGSPEDKATALYELGFVYQKMKLAVKEEATFIRLVEEYPQSSYAADSAFRAGESLYAREHYETAFSAYEFCAKKDADGELGRKAAYKGAWSKLKLGDFQAASQFFVLCSTKGGPLAAESHFQAGTCFYELKKFDESLKHFQVLVDNYRTHELAKPASFRVLTLLAHLGRHREVLEGAGSTLSVEAKDAWSLEAWSAAGDSARELKVYGTAIRAYQHVAEFGARVEAARARYFAADCILASQSKEKAVDAFLKVSIFHQDDQWCAKGLERAAVLLESLGRPGEALKIWRDLKKRYPSQPGAKTAQTHISALNDKEESK